MDVKFHANALSIPFTRRSSREGKRFSLAVLSIGLLVMPMAFSLRADASLSATVTRAADASALRFKKVATCEAAFSQRAPEAGSGSQKLLTNRTSMPKLLTHQNPKPKPTTVDRKAYFETAFDRLGRILQFAEEQKLALSGGEYRMLKEMRAFVSSNTRVSDWGVRYVADLWFLETQGNFIIEEGQPVRTASTRGDVRDPIAVNLPLISKPENEMNVLEVAQLMLHEIGHKTENKVQNDVDSLAAKIIMALQSYHRSIDLGNETSLEVLSIPVTSPNDFVGELTRPSLIALIKYPGGVIDVSQQIIEAVRPVSQATETQPINTIGTMNEVPFQILNHFVWTNEVVRSAGKPDLMSVRAVVRREGQAVNSSSLQRRETISITQPPKDVQELEILLRTGDEPAVISASRRIHYPKLERNGEIVLETDWIDSKTLQISAKGLDGLNVRGLLVKSDNGEFEVAAGANESVASDSGSGSGLDSELGVGSQRVFIVTVPEKTSVRQIRASSIVLEDGSRVSASNSVKIDFVDNFDASSAREKKYLKAKVKTPFGWKPLKEVLPETDLFETTETNSTVSDQKIEAKRVQTPSLVPGKNTIELFVKSPNDLKEVRIRVENELYQYDSSAFSRRPPMHAGMMGDYVIPITPEFGRSRYKTDVVTWIVLREGEFRQSRRGDIVRIEADVDLAIRHKTVDETQRYSQRISRFYTASGRITHRKYVGWDAGTRHITGLELTDQSLHQTRIEAENPLELQLSKQAAMTEEEKRAKFRRYSDSFQ